jgi:hypothetical protein
VDFSVSPNHRNGFKLLSGTGANHRIINDDKGVSLADIGNLLGIGNFGGLFACIASEQEHNERQRTG